MISVNRKICIFLILGFAILGSSACANIPKDPTATPTLSDEEKLEFFKQTAAVEAAMTQTQDAFLNPSPTPLPTDTPPPPIPPTATIPPIPPTATEPPRPFLSVGHKSCFLKHRISGEITSSFVPFDPVYIEICFTNDGSGTWNQNYYAMVTLNDESNTNPSTVALGKEVPPGEKACFSFESSAAGSKLGEHCSTFALTTDQNVTIGEGFITCCWTVH